MLSRAINIKTKIISVFFYFIASATVTAVGEADTMKLIALAVILSCYFVHTYCDECSVDEIQTIQQQWTSTFGDNAIRLFEFGVAFFLRLAMYSVNLLLYVNCVVNRQARGYLNN